MIPYQPQQQSVPSDHNICEGVNGSLENTIILVERMTYVTDKHY